MTDSTDQTQPPSRRRLEQDAEGGSEVVLSVVEGFDDEDFTKLGIELPELARWISQHGPRIAERWRGDVLSTGERHDGAEVELLVRFIDTLMSILPHAMGPLREQAEILWSQTAELYGSFGGVRGLAAGEVVEEIQRIRESVIRQVYVEPPFGDRAPLSLREILRLNRLIDRGVAQASVGHTDALFFAFFQGSGVSRSLTPEAVGELHEQLDAFEGSLEKLQRMRLGSDIYVAED